MNKTIFPFFCNNRRNLSQHEIKNKKKTSMVFDMSYFKLRHSQSHDVSRSILHRQNYLKDYNTDYKPSKILACWWLCKCIRKKPSCGQLKLGNIQGYTCNPSDISQFYLNIISFKDHVRLHQQAWLLMQGLDCSTRGRLLLNILIIDLWAQPYTMKLSVPF